ncbi:peptidyl-prolyl cis-trans isomerase [Candidatus Sumerlaeota bacterium]|nr:peptidyl-prolyl cis-trans isomerase [Candidatus Sumerlaeota bacterium]
MIRLTVTLLALALAGTTDAAPVVLAETDVGVVTPDDLVYQINYHQELPDAELVSERDWNHLPRILRRAAYEHILDHLAETTGLNEDPEHRAWLMNQREAQILARIQSMLILHPSTPTQEEVLAYTEEHREEMRLPPTASWRHMLFAVRGDDSQDLRDTALARAQEARAAVLGGEEFEEVAARLATPPVQGDPGALIGPLVFQGRILPQVEEVLLTVPVGELSEIIESPVGFFLLRVESRDTERYPRHEMMVYTLGMRLVAERREARRGEVIQSLLERYPVVIQEPLTTDMPSDTPALTLGPRVLTLADIELRSHLGAHPEETLAWLLTPMGRMEMIETQLFLAEAEATGLTSSPEFLAELEPLMRYNLVERLEQIFSEQQIDPPTAEEIEARWRERGGRYTQELVSAEALWISHAALQRLASSEYALDELHEARAIRDRWAQGISPDEIAEEIGLDIDQSFAWSRWVNRIPEFIPQQVREMLPSLAPGECSNVVLGPSGAMIVRSIGHSRGIPQLRDVEHLIRSEIARERTPETSLTDELLERYHYRQVVDHTLIRWDVPEVSIRVLSSPEEE